MVSTEMIWRCCLEVSQACSSSCLLLETHVHQCCTSTTGHSGWGELSRSPLQLQFLWSLRHQPPVLGERRLLHWCSSMCLLLPKLWQRQEAEGSWWAQARPGTETFRMKTLVRRGGNTEDISQEKTVAERERAATPGDGCFIPLWFISHVLCLLLLRLLKWKVFELKPQEFGPASQLGYSEWLCGTKSLFPRLGFIAVLLLQGKWNSFDKRQ